MGQEKINLIDYSRALQTVRSTKLCMMAHPDNEEDSEFADRISDLEDLEEFLSVKEMHDKGAGFSLEYMHKAYQAGEDGMIESAFVSEKGEILYSQTEIDRLKEKFFNSLPQGASSTPAASVEERFKKPTHEQVISAAILFNDGKMDEEVIANMTSLAMFITDRLYENGDMTIPSKREEND